MPTSVEMQKAAAESKSMHARRREEIRAAVIKYADGERTRDDVIRMSGVSRNTLRKMELELNLKFGRAW